MQKMMMNMKGNEMPDSCKQMMKDHKGMMMNIDSKMHSEKEMKMDSDKSHNSSIVRKGEIDLYAIDKNKDGKVFQDTMDWNVISDKAGKCPICGMTLKEVTVEKAKENLLQYNFKVKNTVEQR